MFLSRVSALALGRVLRPYLCRKAPVRSSQNPRYLSTTAPRQASESPFGSASEPLAALKNSETFKKVYESRDAILALQKLAQVMQKQGVEVTSGTPPSMVQMSKMLLSSEFREASQNVMEEFKKAGIDVKNKAVIDEFMALMKKGGGSTS